MSKHTEHAQRLRDDKAIHYNCTQAVLVPFAKEMGLTEQQAFDLGFNFGGGMKRASVCGAVTGGLMVMGMHGINDVKVLNKFYDAIKENHEGKLECADLLQVSKKKGIEKKTHCDAMIQQSITLVEKLIEENR
ncbi:MAG: C-GCAxxG-C-C family protein [Anaerovibrio sp.]|uniref:C-GCAxxG-C-C family protein n=1 Tax=Anaerovibrio sp. TaxID=1872532 RepID=UPI0025F34CE8|nr:C-GCAxxG-C-C family protein [Anaerovibrio sp.]MCR5175561.1 C-GCAxxG-C-C family protein [Anaerovibrio sp.]